MPRPKEGECANFEDNCTDAPDRLNLKTVNEELARLGFAERVVKATNYFLFTGGAADDWLDRTVGVRTISSMTLKEWIAEFKRLKALNEQIMGTLQNRRTGHKRRAVY